MPDFADPKEARRGDQGRHEREPGGGIERGVEAFPNRCRRGVSLRAGARESWNCGEGSSVRKGSRGGSSESRSRRKSRREKGNNATHRIRIIVHAETLRFAFGNAVLDDGADSQSHSGPDFCGANRVQYVRIHRNERGLRHVGLTRRHVEDAASESLMSRSGDHRNVQNPTGAVRANEKAANNS